MNGKPKLILIDDKKDFLIEMKDYLSDYADVETSETVKDAISKLTGNGFDIAVIDMAFPKESKPDEMEPEAGLRICEYIKNNNLKTKAIVYTAHGSIKNFRRAHKANIYDYVEKSESPEQLVEAVLEAIKKEDPEAVSVKVSEDYLKKLKDAKVIESQTTAAEVIRKAMSLLMWYGECKKDGFKVIGEKGNKIREIVGEV
jgi:DNA-binding NtrC family response regulator